MSNCEDCGCKVYNGACVNCHEEIYIVEQNYSNDEPVSIPHVLEIARKQELDIKKKHEGGLDG